MMLLDKTLAFAARLRRNPKATAHVAVIDSKIGALKADSSAYNCVRVFSELKDIAKSIGAIPDRLRRRS